MPLEYFDFSHKPVFFILRILLHGLIGQFELHLFLHYFFTHFTAPNIYPGHSVSKQVFHSADCKGTLKSVLWARNTHAGDNSVPLLAGPPLLQQGWLCAKCVLWMWERTGAAAFHHLRNEVK